MLYDPMDCSPPSCPWNFPGKNTGVGCHFLLSGIFPTQGPNLHLLPQQAILYHLTTWEAQTGSVFPLNIWLAVYISTSVSAIELQFVHFAVVPLPCYSPRQVFTLLILNYS